MIYFLGILFEQFDFTIFFFKEFKEGRTEYRGRRGQHDSARGKFRQRTEENISKIRNLIEEDARMTFEVSSSSTIGQDYQLSRTCSRNFRTSLV